MKTITESHDSLTDPLGPDILRLLLVGFNPKESDPIIAYLRERFSFTLHYQCLTPTELHTYSLQPKQWDFLFYRNPDAFEWSETPRDRLFQISQFLPTFVLTQEINKEDLKTFLHSGFREIIEPPFKENVYFTLKSWVFDKAMQTLRKSHFLELLHLSPSLITISDTKGKILFSNWEDEAVSKGEFCRPYCESRPDEKDYCRKCLNSKMKDDKKHIHSRQKGYQGRYWDVDLYLEEEGEEGNFFIIEFARDVTEQVRIESEKATSQALYRELVENANCIILRWNEEGLITFFNEFAQKFFGYSEEEVLGRHVVGTIVPETESSGRDLKPLMADICQHPEKYTYNENENMCSNGDRVWIAWTNKALMDPGGKKGEVLSIGADITQRKKIEARLRQSEKMQAIGQLAGGIAHDFNNQLTGVMGYAELLSGSITNPRLKKYSDRIVDGVRRASDLTQKLLAFARKGKYLSVSVDMNDVIRDLIMLIKHSFPKSIYFKEALWATKSSVLGDPTQLHSALLNIAINAKDAMQGGGSIEIGTDVYVHGPSMTPPPSIKEIPYGNYLKIWMRDSGTGIDPDSLKHIFEPFYTTKPHGKGTGMGLAAVYGTVKNHKGFVWAENNFGAGCCFTILLPLKRSGEIEERKAEEVKKDPSLKGNVMIVDDERSVREMVSEMLFEFGYQSINYKNGMEALKYYKNHSNQVDLVILDMIMPGMGGEEVLKKMLEINSSAKVILVSGYVVDEKLPQKAIVDGAFDFLKKPFSMEQLRKTLVRALKS